MLARYPTILNAMDRIREIALKKHEVTLLHISDFWKIHNFIVGQAILIFLDPVTKAKDCDLVLAYKDVTVAKVHSRYKTR